MVNANQYHFARHKLDIENPNNMDVQRIHHIPNTNVHTNISVRTSGNLDSNTLGNEISTNYTNSREPFKMGFHP
jgi:hypothetical protein